MDTDTADTDTDTGAQVRDVMRNMPIDVYYIYIDLEA